MAGGNGIGLKQTALVLFRDYHIQKFIIRGKTRNVEYKLLTKEQINEQMRTK